jgi:sialate O-acetylesterase
VLALQVPEAKQYLLVYELDLNTAGAEIHYATNNADAMKEPFGFARIAYSLELEREGSEPQFVYVSMDAFTDDLKKIGIPTAKSGAHFQQNVTHLNVYSNVKNVTTGTDLPGGNIEFWPNNYGPANSAKVPNASSDVYDFGDEPSDPTKGYGSMQIHNHDARQTIFAINHWKEGPKADVGIGNQPTGNSDWTFAANAAAYKTKRLRVFIRTR